MTRLFFCLRPKFTTVSKCIIRLLQVWVDFQWTFCQATRTVIAKYWLLPDRSDCVTQPRIWHIRVLYCTSKINNGYSRRVLYFLPLVYERCCPACVSPSNRLVEIWFRHSHRAALGGINLWPCANNAGHRPAMRTPPLRNACQEVL
jgi:hypothetical protein